MDLGRGNILTAASVQIDEIVLDLGCDGGFDSFIAARAVGAGSHVIGADTFDRLYPEPERALKTLYSLPVQFKRLPNRARNFG